MNRIIIMVFLAAVTLAGCGTAGKAKQTTGTEALVPVVVDKDLKRDSVAERISPWVEFLRTPDSITFQPQFDFLCMSEYPATVSINGVELKQYKTGIFFTTVNFTEGVNKVRAEATTPDGRTAFCEKEFIYEKRDMTRKTFPLWIEERSVEPSAELELLPEDVVRVSFRGSLGQDGYAGVTPGKTSVRCSRQDFADYSLYRAELPLEDLSAGKNIQAVS